MGLNNLPNLGFVGYATGLKYIGFLLEVPANAGKDISKARTCSWKVDSSIYLVFHSNLIVLNLVEDTRQEFLGEVLAIVDSSIVSDKI